MKSYIGLFLLFFHHYLFAQKHGETFDEGMALYQVENYYEAYLRFRAASVLSEAEEDPAFAEKNQYWLEKSAAGIQRQQVKTDSLLKATKKLTDALYFWDGRLALAYKEINGNGKYGFINKQGEVVIGFNYNEAENFDEETGYAKVVRGRSQYWLSPNGKVYKGELEVNSLPEVTRKPVASEDTILTVHRDLSTFRSSGSEKYNQILNEGIQYYENSQYYDAFLRFHKATQLAQYEKEAQVAKVGQQLRDSAISQIRQLTRQTEKALHEGEKIRDAIYFYQDKYALAFRAGTFYFIDQEGNTWANLGEWKLVKQFDSYGFARVKNGNGEIFLLDTRGHTCKLANRVKDLQLDITALDLRGRRLISFPQKILNHHQLEVLILDGEWGKKNLIFTVPPDIKHLKKLTFLSLNYAYIKTLPAEIGQLQNLTDLNLRYNDLSTIPPEIGQLQNLTDLNLRSNELSNLAPEIGQLQNLTDLNLRYNDLSTIPPEIGQLQNLTDLNLLGNELSHLPPEIGQLQNLTDLNLWRNELSTLPPEIGQLKSLIYLNLRDNELSDLPPEIGQLQNLAYLNLRDNELSDLPPEIGQLQNLTDLNLWGNELSTLPPEIGQLKNLTSLNLWFNELRTLRPEICQLQNLTELDLSGSRFKSFPQEIGQLKNLTELGISGIGFSSFPQEIGQFKNLTKLDLSSNAFSTFPQEVEQLKSLTRLDLSGNELSTLPPEIGQLKSLTRLDLSDNELSTLPPEIGQLKSLTSLRLSGNLLSSLPPEIGQLHDLTFLYLWANELSTLPPEVGLLQNLDYLRLWSNPIPRFKRKAIKKQLPNCKIEF